MAATDESDIPETGAVFTFGKSRFAENLPNKFWVKNDRVLQVACGDEHTALVAESGRVFMFGPNDYGQLGIGHQKMANRPTCIKTLKHEKSRLVACGRSHTIVATESGNIYTFGANGEGQLAIEGVTDSHVPSHVETLPSTKWKMLAAGCGHSMALTEDGKVFVWGDNGEGQLGMGEESEIHVPQKLDVGQPVICIACGYYHSALVTESGELYTFGESDEGKLGLGDDTDESSTPQHVMAIADKVKAVSCGGSHTVALTEKGELYSFGNGANGQLGLGVSVQESKSPSLLKLPFKVSQVCCGENFTAIVSVKGQLYTFGDGRHGKLALGQESFSNQFVQCKVDRFLKFTVGRVACGGCHMIVTAVPKVQNGTAESEEEEEEQTMMNGTIRDSLSLTRTFSARDRRRNASPLPLHRTLPPLGANRGLPELSATLPAIKMSEQKLSRTEPQPRLQRTKKIEKMSEEEESEEEDESKEKAEKSQPVKSQRKVPPRPSKVNDDENHSSGDNKKQESEEEKENVDSSEEKDAKSEEKDAKSEEKDEEDEENNQLRKAPVPVPRKGEDKEEEEEEDKEEEEEEEEKSAEEDETEKEKDEEKGKDKKKKDKKDKKDKKEEKKKDKKDKKKDKDKKKKGKKGEEDEEDEEEEEEDKDKAKKGKDKKKDKEKEDKKKKKGKKDKEDEEEEEEDEEKDKKGKEKDKKKKKKGDEDEDEDKDKKDENENDGGRNEDGKKNEEKPKKKSRLCTVL